MDLHLTGKRAVVTGARGRTDSLMQLAAGTPVHPVSVDLSTADGPQRLVHEAVSVFAR